MSNLDKLNASKNEFDIESQSLIEGFNFLKREISVINTMKGTAGWKLVDSKIRDELRARILEMVKDDPKVQILIQLLDVADTKKMSKTLEAEIDKVLPED